MSPSPMTTSRRSPRRVLLDYYRFVLNAYADGLIDGATAMTATHVSTRHQFGKPIALFQAVGQQLADISTSSGGR